MTLTPAERMGLNILNARQSKSVTQTELAEIVGINRKTLSRYERGVREPCYTILRKIADALDITFEEVVDNVY